MTLSRFFDLTINFRFSIFSSVCLFFALPVWGLEKWRDVTAEEFAIEASSIEADASVEILFAEFKAHQSIGQNGLSGMRRTYHRMKVFSEAGVDILAKHQVRAERGERVKNIIARTVKPDGTTVELEKDDIFDLTLEEGSFGSRRAKTFAFPSLEAGDIVEVQVEYDIDDVSEVYSRFTGPFPTRRVTVRIKPAEAPGLAHRMLSFGLPSDSVYEKDGDYHFYEVRDVRAELDEKYAPPRFQTEPIVAMYYVREYFEDPEDFWKDFSRELARDGKSDFKASKAIKAKANELVKGYDRDEEKLRRILEFCTEEFTNLTWDSDRYSDVELDKLKDNRNATNTLENGYGKPRDLRTLFGALASSLGFDVRHVAIADRRNFFFTPDAAVRFVLNNRLIAVKSGEDWLYFDPGNPALRFGELSWNHANSICLIGDPKDIVFSNTPKHSSGDAIADTVAELELDENGHLHGRVTKTLSGQKALSERNAYRKLTLDEIEDKISEYEIRHYTDAKIENISIENLKERKEPLVIAYDIEIKNYADSAGSRIFVAPAVFQKDLSVPFVEEKRATDIIFQSPWRDRDRIEIRLPEGYEFEAGDAPMPFDLGGVLVYESRIQINKKTNTLILERDFEVAQEIIPLRAYSVVKGAFEALKIEDGKSITIKKDEEES